ncbi:MAG TPA: FMN-binding protein [Vicinamibacterales bacterium]
MDQQAPPSEPVAPEKGRGPSKIANSLVALSSAAVLTVYAAGYLRTRSAAARFAVEAADLGTAGPVAGAPVTAAAPPESTDAVKLAEAAPAVPASPVPGSSASAPPSEITSPEASPAPLDSTASPSASAPTPGPAPTEESTAPSSAAATTEPAPAAADSAKAEPPAAPAAPRESKFKDGTYSGWGYSRHGDIQAAVVVQDGRVVSAEITQCLTRYSCSVIDMLPAQVLSRQNAFVDLISGATESANAYSNAIYRALASSQK